MVDVDRPPVELVDEVRSEDPHVAGQDDQVGIDGAEGGTDLDLLGGAGAGPSPSRRMYRNGMSKRPAASARSSRLDTTNSMVAGRSPVAHRPSRS